MSDLPPPRPANPSPPPPPTSTGPVPMWSSPSPSTSPPPPAGWAPRGQAPSRLSSAFYSPAIVILLTVVTFGIWALVWTYRTGDDLRRYRGDGLGGGLMLLITVLVAPVVMFIIPNEIEAMYRGDGRTSPMSALLGFWSLLPLIGPLIWYVKVQSALNDFWRSRGSVPG